MKQEYNIDTTSWHFELMQEMRLNPKQRTDFCSYWRGVCYACIRFIGIIAILLGIVYLLLAPFIVSGYVTLYTSMALNPEVFFLLHPLIGLPAFVGTLVYIMVGTAGILCIAVAGTFELVIYLANMIIHKAQEKESNNSSIFYIKYRSWKDKFCPQIKFK